MLLSSSLKNWIRALSELHDGHSHAYTDNSAEAKVTCENPFQFPGNCAKQNSTTAFFFFFTVAQLALLGRTMAVPPGLVVYEKTSASCPVLSSLMHSFSFF